MADKVGLGSGSVPPQNTPPTQAAASEAESPAGAGGAESPSKYFYEIAQSGYEFLAKYAQAAAEAQKPKEIKPEEAAAHFDQAEKEFQSTYKDAGTGPAAEAQAKSKIDAMQAAMPALIEQAKDPELQAYIKELQSGDPAGLEPSDAAGVTAGEDGSRQGAAPAPKDPAKAKTAFEILSRMRALEQAKHQYYSKYHKGSLDDLARRSLGEQRKAEAMLKEMGEGLRAQPNSVEAQRLLVEIDEEVEDYVALHRDLQTWKQAAQGLKDPVAKIEELNSVLKEWARQYDKMLDLSAAEVQAEVQAVKDEIVAILRDNPKLISADQKPIPNGAEHVRVMLDRVFPPPPGGTIVRRDLLAGLSLEGMGHFAQLSVEADAAMMSAMQKSQAGDAQGAKEDYLKALGAYAELRDEAAARAMDREIRKLLGRGGAPIEDYKMLGRIHAELKGSGLKLEAELKEEIASPEWMGFFLESSMKVTNRHLRGADSKVADGQELAEILEVAENLIQAVKIRQEAGIANDDPVQLMEIDRLQLVMRKNADARKLGSKERLELREKVVRLDVARFPEYVDALTRPIRGAWETGLLDRIAHPERSGAIGVGIVAEDIGKEMLEHLKAWEEDLDHSELEPKEELDRRADMSAVLSLFYPLTKIGENPPLNQEQLTPLVRRNAEHLQALASQVIAERFPMVAREPELLQAMGEDISALSQEAVQRGDASFAALLRNPKGLEAFAALSYKAYNLETQAKALEAKVEADKQKKLPEEKFAKSQAEALHLRMQAAELYSKRGGPPDRVKTVLKPAMDFFEGVAADPNLSAADRAESLLDIAKLYQEVRLPEEAARVYEKVVAMERDLYLSGKVDEGLRTAATLAQGHRALLKAPPDYDAAKKFFQSLPGVEEAQRSYDAIVAYQRSQRLPKVLGALEAVAAEYAQKLEQRKGKAEAAKFRAEFKARAELFRGKLESGDYRAIEDLFAAFGYVRHDAHQGRDFYKWAVGESDSIDWQEFNEKSLSLLQTATNPEATDHDFAALGLEMGTYLGSAGDFDLFQAGAKDVAYFGAASQVLDMMGNDRYVGVQAKSYRTGIANRSVIHETGVFLGNLSVVGAESLSEAGKSAALWLVPAGVGRLAGAGARLLGAGERLSVLANVAASSLSGMLVESAWTGNWDAFSAKGLATTGTTTFISYFGYRHIARLSQKLGEAAKRSSTFGQRVAGQAAIGFSTRVMLEMGEFTAGGLFEAGMSFAQEGLGIQKVSELEKEASLILRIFSKVLKGGFEEKRENLGEGFAGRLIDYSTGGWLQAAEQKVQLQDRRADMEAAARGFGWELDFNAAKAWIEERRPVDGAKAGEKELAALLSMDPRRLEAISKNPSKIAQAKEAVQKLYPDLDPTSWEAQLRAFQVLDYFEVQGGKGIAAQFSEFQKTAESLGIRSPEHLSAYYELAFRGLTPKQAKKMAKELAATPKLNDKLDVLVDVYVQPGAKLTADLRDTMRAEVVLSLLEEAVTSKKSPGALLEREVQAATPFKKTPEASPDAGPYRSQANFAGLPWTLGDVYEGLAKLLGITTQKAAKEQGWKQLDAWVEATSRDPGPSSDAVPSEALAKAVAQGGKKPARAADTLVEGSGITHPGLAEKLQLRFERMGLDAGQISALAKSSAKFQKGLRAIAEGLLGKGALDTPQGQLLAAELLLKAVEFGDQGKDPAKALQYFKKVALDLREAKPQLDAAAEKLLQARDVHHSPAAYSVKTTLFLKALQDAATGKNFAASLAAWTEPSLLGRIAEVLLETEATGVSTPEGRGRIAKKFIALLGAAGTPKALLGALYPAESRPIPLNPQGIASVEEVGGRARTKYAEIEVEAGKARLFPNPGRKVEVYNPVTKTWVPAKEGQPLKSGTWIRQEGKDLGRKLFTLTPEGEVYLEEIGAVAARMEEGGSVLRALHENFPAWFGVGEALSLRANDDLTKIVPEFFRRVEGDRNPDWDRWYGEIEGAVSALEPAVQALPAHQQAEFRIALMRKLAGGELNAERARTIAEEVLKSPLDPALFQAGEGGPVGDFFGAFEARQPKQDYGDVFGDEAPLGVHGLPDQEVDVFGDGAEMPLPAEEVIPQAIAAAEEDWWLGSGTAPDTESAGVDAVEDVIPFLPPQRSKAPTVKYPDQVAAARLGQPEAIAKILGQEAMAEGMRQMEAALQDAAEPAQILIRLPKGESREDALVAISEKADALKLTLEDFGGPGELVFLTPSGRKVLVKVEVEGAASMSPPPKLVFQEEDEAEADAYYDEVLRALQHDTDRSEQVLPKAEAAPLPDEKDLLRGPIRDRMSQALFEFFGTRVNRTTIAEAFPGAAEVFRVFEEAGELIKRIERSDWGSKAWADLRKELEALRPQIEAADALWVQSQSVKYYMSFLDTAFTPLVVRTQNALAEAEIPVQAIQTPEWLDSPDFELGMLDDAARAREGKPPRFAAPAMLLETTDAEAAATLEAAVLKKAEALGLELVAKKPGKLEFRTPMGGGFEVRIEAVPRRVKLDPQAEKIPLGPKSYLERSGDRWIFKNPGKESWFIGADARGVITGEPVLGDGDLLVSFDGQAVVLEDPVLRAKPAFRVASGVSALKIPEHPFDKIPPPQELRDHGIRLGRNFEKIEVTYQAKPGEKLLIRRPGQTEPIEVKPLNEAASGGKSAKERPVAVALQADDVLEIHTVSVGKKNTVASFPFGTYGGLVGLPKLPSKKPVLAGQLTAADRESVTLQDLPALGQVPERPQVVLKQEDSQVFLRPYQITDAILPGAKLGRAVKVEPVPGEKGRLLVTFELETLGVEDRETVTLPLSDTEAHRLGLVGPTGKLLPKGKIPVLQVTTLRALETVAPPEAKPVAPLLPGRHPIAGPVAGFPRGADLKIVLQGESKVEIAGEFLLEGEGLRLRAVSDQVQVFAETGREGPGGLNAVLSPKTPEGTSQTGAAEAKTWSLAPGDVVQVGDQFFAVKGKVENQELIPLAGDPRVISKQEWERRAKEPKAPTRAYLEVSFSPAELEISGARVDAGPDGALYLTQGKGFTVVDAKGQRLTVLQQEATALQAGDKLYYDEGLGTALPSKPVYLGEVVAGKDGKAKWKPAESKTAAVDREAVTDLDLPAVTSKALEPSTLSDDEVEIVLDRPGVDFEEVVSAPIDREAVTEMDLPALPPLAAPPWSGLLAGLHQIALQAVPYLPLMPAFVDAVLSQGLLGGGVQLSMAWFGKWGDKLKALLPGGPKEEPIPAVFQAPVAAKIALKPVLVRDGGGEGIAIGGDGDRSSGGKILGQFHIPGLIAGVKFHYLDDYGVPKLYPTGMGGFEVQVRLKANDYQVKKLKLTQEGIDFENGDQIVLPHAQGSVTLTLRVRQEGGKDVYEVESSRLLVDLGLEGLSIGFPAGKNSFTFGERNEDDRRATAAGGVGAIQNPQTYGKIEQREDGSFLLRPLAPVALRQIFLIDAQGAETPVTQPTRIAPGQKILVKNPTDPNPSSNRILFRFEHEADIPSVAAPAVPPQATPQPPAEAVSPLEAGSYVWDAGLDMRYLPESTDVAVRHPDLTGEDVLALLRRDGQDLWVVPRSEVVQVLDASGRPLGLASGFDSQTGEKISQGYRVPEQAYLRVGDKLYARQGTEWVPLQQDPWSGRSLRRTGDLEFEIPVKGRSAPDAALTPVAVPMPVPEIRAAAVVDPGAQKITVENFLLAVQDNQPDKPRRAAYAQNQPTSTYGSFAAHTDEGLGGKPVNEDAYGVLPEYGVGIVADGMGGMGGGDKASAVAVGKLAEIVKSPNWDGDLKQALIQAGRAVNQEVNPPSDPTKKAGTTAVVQRVVQKNGRTYAEIAHVGDAGALVLRPKPDGGIEVVFATREQSMVAEWRGMGALKNTMEMRWSPQAHVVSGGLGLRKEAKPEFASVELRQGDWTLLFSDGIGDNFSKDELSVLVRDSKTPEEARDRILASLRLKMERLQIGSEQLEAGQDVFLVPVQEKGADIEELNMVPIDGLQDYYLGEGGKVVGRAVQFKDAQGQVRTGVEVPWAEGRFAVRNAKGEMEYFHGEAVQGLGYFLPVDRYKADNVSIHVYKHELLPASDEEWRIDDVLDETPQTLVSNGPPTTKMKPVQGAVPPPPTVKLAPIAEEIPPTYKLLQAVSAPKHPEEPGTPSSSILARVGSKEIDLSVATKEPQVVYREGPVVVELSVDALGRYLLKGKGFNWGTKPVVLEFEGKKFQLSRSKPSAPPLEAKSAPPAAKIETTPAAPAGVTSDFKTGLSESKGELAASDIPSGVEMELMAMPTALWDRDSDKNEVRVEDVLAEKSISVGTLTRDEAGGLTLQIRKGLPPAYEVDLRDSAKALKKGAKGSHYDPIALAEGDRIGIGSMGIMKFVVVRDEKGLLVLRPDGIDQKVRVNLSASSIVSAKSEQPSPFKKMIEDSMKAKAPEAPALPAFSPEERLAQASNVSPKERLGIACDDKLLSDPREFQDYVDSTKRLLGPTLSEQLGFLLVDSPEGRARVQKLREAIARRAGHSYPNVDKLREYAAEALLQEGIDISEGALREMGLKKSLGVVNLTLGQALLPQLYPNDVPVALTSGERNAWTLGDAGFSELFRPQHPAILRPGTTLGEIRAKGYLDAVAGNMLVAGYQFSFKPYPGAFSPAAPVVQLEGQLFSLRQSGDSRDVFTFTSLANPKHQVVLEGPLGTDPKLAVEVARTSAKQAGKATALEDIIPLLLLENPQNIPVKLPLELRAFQILGWIAEQNGKTPRAYSAPEIVKEVVDKSGEPIDMQNTLFDMEFFDRYSLSLRAMDRGQAEALLKMVQDSFGASLDPEQIRGPEPFSDAKGKGLRLRLEISQPSGVQSNGKMLEIKVYGPN